MAHNEDYSLIYVSSTAGLSIDEIKTCIGSTSNDTGTLCKSQKIKACAKYKPERRSVLGPLTDLGSSAPDPAADRQSNPPYSIKILIDENKQLVSAVDAGSSAVNSFILGSTFELTYLRPTAWFRILDFSNGIAGGIGGGGYYNGAPDAALTCANRSGSTLTYNSMDADTNGDTILFYAFFKGMTASGLNNAAFSTTAGIDTSHHLVPTTPSYYLASCLSAEELFANLISAGTSFFGVLLYQSNAFKGFFPCFKAIGNYSSPDTSMYQIPMHSSRAPQNGRYEGIINDRLGSDNLHDGTYDAVPVLKHGNYYYPMFHTTNGGYNYGGKFTLKIGGEDFYESGMVYVCTQSDGSGTQYTGGTISLPTDKLANTYIAVRLWNVDYTKSTTIYTDNQTKFKLHAHISGQIVSLRETEYIDDDYDMLVTNGSSGAWVVSQTGQLQHTSGPPTNPDNSQLIVFKVQVGTAAQTTDPSTYLEFSGITLYYDQIPIGISGGWNQSLGRRTMRINYDGTV